MTLRLHPSSAAYQEATLILTALGMLKNPCLHPEMDLAEAERRAAIEHIEGTVWPEFVQLVSAGEYEE